MQNKSSAAATTEVQTKSEPVASAHADGPNWTAIAAIIISVFTLLKSLWTDFRTSRTRHAAEFEATYGGPIRNGLRDFDKRLKTLRAFTLASGLTLDDLKREIDTLRGDWEDAANDVADLLAEVDRADCLVKGGWEKQFRDYAKAAEVALQSISHANVADVSSFSARASMALGQYKQGIDQIRENLRQQAASYSKLRYKKRQP